MMPWFFRDVEGFGQQKNPLNPIDIHDIPIIITILHYDSHYIYPLPYHINVVVSRFVLGNNSDPVYLMGWVGIVASCFFFFLMPFCSAVCCFSVSLFENNQLLILQKKKQKKQNQHNKKNIKNPLTKTQGGSPWAALIFNSMFVVVVLYCVQLFFKRFFFPKSCSPFLC